MVAEIAATLAFSAIQNNDKIGVIFFTDKVEKFIPPEGEETYPLHHSGNLGFTESNGTDLNMALRYDQCHQEALPLPF